MQHIVKRSGHSETFDNRKLYASVYSACLSVHEHSGSAELIAKEICDDVEAWLADKAEVTSNDIRKRAGRILHDIQPDAAAVYTHHRVFW